MKVTDIRAIEGKNIYSFQKVIKMIVSLGSYHNLTTAQLGAFNEVLVGLIPSLEEHYCAKGIAGGFIERLKEGTMLGHVIEHVALELQTLAGCQVIYGKTRSTDIEGVYEIVYEYEIKAVGLTAGLAAFEIVNQILDKKPVELKEILAKLSSCSALHGLGPSTKAIVTAAKKRDIPMLELENSLVQLGYGKYQKRIGATISQNTSCLAVDIASDKYLTKQLLWEAGIPVPRGCVVSSNGELQKAWQRLEKPLVVKPLDGNHGKGVSIKLTTFAEFVRAFEIAKLYCNSALVEEYVEGKQYRILVVNNAVCAAAERVPPYVIGDGISTIKELVNVLNKDPRRGEGHEKPLTKIKLDSVVLLTLAKKGITPDSVLEKGRKLALRESANLSTGAFSVDVTEQLHPKVKEMAIRTAQIIGLDIAGIDIISKDLGLPLNDKIGSIIEVNAAPGLRMHLYPDQGIARPCGEAIVDYLFPKGKQTRVPIVSVTGTNGKTTTARLIASMLNRSGLKVGLTTTDGIYIGNNLVVQGDMAGPLSAKAVLKDPTIEAAVLETARGGIISRGLGYDKSDVGIITNISADHLGQQGINCLEDLAYVKSLVVETVRKKGYAILNADDDLVMSVTPRVNCKTIFFSLQENNIYVRRHLGIGGKAIFLKKGYVIFAEGNQIQKIAHAKEIPITLEGLAVHNMQNVLAATAAAVALGIELRHIKEVLTSFKLTLQDNPGRLNIFDLNGFKVVIDYGHNEAAYKNTIDMLKKIKHKRLTGIIGLPGDRPDDNIVQVGRIAGAGFNQVFIKEDKDLRGRKVGEVASLLKKGVQEAGLKTESLKVVLNEEEALAKALKAAKQGEIIVIFYEKLDPIIAIIEQEIENSVKKAVLKKRKKLLTEENLIG